MECDRNADHRFVVTDACGSRDKLAASRSLDSIAFAGGSSPVNRRLDEVAEGLDVPRRYIGAGARGTDRPVTPERVGTLAAKSRALFVGSYRSRSGDASCGFGGR